MAHMPKTAIPRSITSLGSERRLLFTVDGEQRNGTLNDYAEVWRQAQYACEHVDLSAEVATHGGRRHEVVITHGPRDALGSIVYTLSIPGAEVNVTIAEEGGYAQ